MRVEHLFGLVDDQHRALGEDVELRIGDQHRDLDHAIRVRLKPVISMSIQMRLLGSPAMDYSLTGMPNAFTWVFLAALAVAAATRLWLSLRQIRHVRAHRGAVPGMFAEAIPLAAHQKAADYTVAKARLGIIDTMLDAAILLALTLGGALQWLADLWARVFAIESLWHGTALILTVFVLKGILGLPLDLYRVFVVEERFGFNRMTPLLYFTDMLKHLLVGAVLGIPLLLVMGASLLYGSGGSLGIDAFARALAADDGLSRAAVVLVVLAFFLKGAIVPFHAWAPDAYEGASVPVTAYMATIVKAGVLLAVVRLFGGTQLATPMLEIFAVLPLLSIVWGNLAAMRQPSLRRMIAYSSIAHAGYLFYALLGDAAGRLQAVAFYLLAYGLMNLLAFAVLPAADDDVERDRLVNLKGLFHRAPFAALMLAVAMLSLAGIPPFPGFVAKFLIFKNVMAAGHTALRRARPRRQLPRHLLLPAPPPVHVHEPRCPGRRPPLRAAHWHWPQAWRASPGRC